MVHLQLQQEITIFLISSHYLSLTSPFIGTFTWPTPPGPYRATTCRGRGLNYGSQTYFLDHTRTRRASPDELSALCRGHLRDSTNMKDTTHQAHTQSSQQGEYGMMITMAKWYSGTIGGPKVSRHLSFRWGKIPKKPRPGNLSRPGPLRDKRACYHLLHSGGQITIFNLRKYFHGRMTVTIKFMVSHLIILSVSLQLDWSNPNSYPVRYIEWQEIEESYIMQSYMRCIFHPTQLVILNRDDWDRQDM